MKTERRQELRTNELSQQLDQLGEYIQKNWLTLSAVSIGVIGLAAAIFWYIDRERSQFNEAWATLSGSSQLIDGGGSLADFESVAQAKISPGITAEAWLSVGNKALAEATKAANPTPGEEKSTTDPEAMYARAEAAFERVAKDFSDNLSACGEALMRLGITAENRGNMDKARTTYQKVLDQKRFEDTPWSAEAAYRIEHLDEWAMAQPFPEPANATGPPPPGIGDSLLSPTELGSSPVRIVPSTAGATPTDAGTTNDPDATATDAAPAEAGDNDAMGDDAAGEAPAATDDSAATDAPARAPTTQPAG